MQKGEIIRNTLQLFVHIINDCNILVYNALKKNTPYRNQNIIWPQLT